jgi:hypothetical protein
MMLGGESCFLATFLFNRKKKEGPFSKFKHFLILKIITLTGESEFLGTQFKFILPRNTTIV